ncbi:hypothetical protein PMI05_03983, partial [Brevibacillus sp. BC25]
ATTHYQVITAAALGSAAGMSINNELLLEEWNRQR